MTGQGRLGWYLVDGLPYWLVDKLLRLHRERFPALSRCFAENRIGAFQPLRPNCQTPASLAALFSGSNSAETWLSGFDQPDFSDPAMVRSKRAFGGLCGDVRLIWDWAAEAGMKVSLAHLPYVDRARLGSALASYAYGFGPAVVAPAVFDCQEATALFGRDQLAAIAGDCWGSLWVYRPAERGQPDDRVRGLAKRCVIGGAEKLLFLGAWRVERSGLGHQSPGDPFMATGLQHWYRRGDLGPTLQQGGDGRAEALFVETLRLMAASFAEEWLSRFAAAPSGLVMTYQPALDLALHELAGYAAPDCTHWTSEREAIVLPLLGDLVADVDRTMQQTMALMQPCDRMILTSDHGMTPVDLIVRPNVALAQDGLLALDGDGRIDPAASLCFYHPAENGLLCLNRNLVAERGTSEQSVVAELAATLDRASGRDATIQSWPALEAVSGAPPWMSARYFLSGGRFVQVKADLAGPVASPSLKTGEHIATRDDMELAGTVIDLSPILACDVPQMLDIVDVHRLLLPRPVAAPMRMAATA